MILWVSFLFSRFHIGITNVNFIWPMNIFFLLILPIFLFFDIRSLGWFAYLVSIILDVLSRKFYRSWFSVALRSYRKKILSWVFDLFRNIFDFFRLHDLQFLIVYFLRPFSDLFFFDIDQIMIKCRLIGVLLGHSFSFNWKTINFKSFYLAYFYLLAFLHLLLYFISILRL